MKTKTNTTFFKYSNFSWSKAPLGYQQFIKNYRNQHNQKINKITKTHEKKRNFFTEYLKLIWDEVLSAPKLFAPEKEVLNPLAIKSNCSSKVKGLVLNLHLNVFFVTLEANISFNLQNLFGRKLTKLGRWRSEKELDFLSRLTNHHAYLF